MWRTVRRPDLKMPKMFHGFSCFPKKKSPKWWVTFPVSGTPSPDVPRLSTRLGRIGGCEKWGKIPRVADSTSKFFGNWCSCRTTSSRSFTMHSTFPFLLAPARIVAKRLETASHAALLQWTLVVWHHGGQQVASASGISADGSGFQLGLGGFLEGTGSKVVRIFGYGYGLGMLGVSVLLPHP